VSEAAASGAAGRTAKCVRAHDLRQQRSADACRHLTAEESGGREDSAETVVSQLATDPRPEHLGDTFSSAERSYSQLHRIARP